METCTCDTDVLLYTGRTPLLRLPQAATYASHAFCDTIGGGPMHNEQPLSRDHYRQHQSCQHTEWAVYPTMQFKLMDAAVLSEAAATCLW